ncbi:MAG: aminotransferase class I/II-fold pyridoxal phosphate-dependent enzyme, partial [Clostridia bacterium]|nr:aminotransferase class I/II-fold pyridoxal phosphate-dependent enzyme [Clostridia bacterium]
MSKFFSKKFQNLVPYTPGEQPTDQQYVKLNTNESPFPPSPKARAYAAEAARRLMLYPDPECKALRVKLGECMGVAPTRVLPTNGSDEILEFAFMAWCDDTHPAVFADITYGFYQVFADLYNIPCTRIPLKEDFTIDIADYCKAKGTIFIANPNAPTGLALSVDEIETIVQSDPTRVVVIDEAYVDFGGESCIPLTEKYDNLLVTGTFSK